MPAVAFEHRLVIGGVARKREFQRLLRARWQVHEFQKLKVLAPRVRVPAELHGPPVLRPVPDRREPLAAGRRAKFRAPEITHDRLTRGDEFELLRRRQIAVGIADVFAEGEKRAVWREEVQRLLHAVVQFDLELHRIGLDIHEPPGRGMLRQRHGAAMEIDDVVRLRKQRAELRVAHAEAARLRFMKRVEAPAPAEIETAHHGINERRRFRRAVALLGLHEHGRRARMLFDVVRLAAEPFEAHEVMHRLPHDARDRHLRHHAEHDDLRAASEVHVCAPPDGRRVRRFACEVCKSESCL